LHRADLTVPERSQHVAEWGRLVKVKPGDDLPPEVGEGDGVEAAEGVLRQVGAKPTDVGGRPEGVPAPQPVR